MTSPTNSQVIAQRSMPMVIRGVYTCVPWGVYMNIVQTIKSGVTFYRILVKCSVAAWKQVGLNVNWFSCNKTEHQKVPGLPREHTHQRISNIKVLSFKISKVHSSDRLHIGLIFCPDLHVRCDHISDQTWMNCRSFEYKLANSCTAPISLNVIEHNNQFCANSYILLKNFISKCDEIPVQIHLAKYYSLMRL